MNNNISLKDIDYIFNNTDPSFLEELACSAKEITSRFFGRTVSLYAPLYLSSYCDNSCLYCGFSNKQPLERKKLSLQEIEEECGALSGTGIQNILLLTGESRKQSSPDYIKDAVLIAKGFFPNISLEVYPMETYEYKELFIAGADGVTVYQETYNMERYNILHPAGRKRDYKYRYETPDRIAEAGFRQVSIGALLGLSDWKQDMAALFDHLSYLEKKFPAVEFSLSFPRLQKLTDTGFGYFEVSDADMVRIISTARLLFPRVGINISTRENAGFRDNIIGIGVTKMSAGSSTTVGGYVNQNDRSRNVQFKTNDERSLNEIKNMLMGKGYDPVITDWRRIVNE